MDSIFKEITLINISQVCFVWGYTQRCSGFILDASRDNSWWSSGAIEITEDDPGSSHARKVP